MSVRSYRLVHALVREVVVDEKTGKVEIAPADLDAEMSDDSETAPFTTKKQRKRR